MTKAHLQEQLDAITKGAGELEVQLSRIEQHRTKIANDLIATSGAIQMLTHLISVDREEESKQAKPPAE